MTARFAAMMLAAATMLLERIQGLDAPARDVVVPMVASAEDAEDAGLTALEAAHI